MVYTLGFTKDYLAHSAKGTTWKDHKYIRKENGRYIYDEKDKAKFEADLEKYEDAHHQDMRNKLKSPLGGLSMNPTTKEGLAYERAENALYAMKLADEYNKRAMSKTKSSVDSRTIDHYIRNAEYMDKKIKRFKKKR